MAACTDAALWVRCSEIAPGGFHHQVLAVGDGKRRTATAGNFCNHFLEHIVDGHGAMAELHRVLQPEGWAILQAPIANKLTATSEDSS